MNENGCPLVCMRAKVRTEPAASNTQAIIFKHHGAKLSNAIVTLILHLTHSLALSLTLFLTHTHTQSNLCVSPSSWFFYWASHLLIQISTQVHTCTHISTMRSPSSFSPPGHTTCPLVVPWFHSWSGPLGTFCHTGHHQINLFQKNQVLPKRQTALTWSLLLLQSCRSDCFSWCPALFQLELWGTTDLCKVFKKCYTKFICGWSRGRG